MKYNTGFSFFFCCCFVLQSTAQRTIEKLSFLDSYVVSNKQYFSETLIGGLSGIDRVGDTYYLVADDAKKPRFYTAKIPLRNRKIDTVQFESVVHIDTSSRESEKKHLVYDLEGIVVDSLQNTVFLTSEGDIRKQKSPFLFAVSSNGKAMRLLNTPAHFSAEIDEGPYHNGAFEGLCKSTDGKGVWAAMELPLKSDARKPTFTAENYPIRITYFDKELGQATSEFSYLLSSLERPQKGRVNINGLTAILAYSAQQFLIVERSYQSGYKNDTNRVRIFLATLHEKTTNTLSVSALKLNKVVFADKELLFDFETEKQQLSSGQIDNIEGITFGPVLPNGNRTLVLISDNNFNVFGQQENQFIVLEIHTEESHGK